MFFFSYRLLLTFQTGTSVLIYAIRIWLKLKARKRVNELKKCVAISWNVSHRQEFRSRIIYGILSKFLFLSFSLALSLSVWLSLTLSFISTILIERWIPGTIVCESKIVCTRGHNTIFFNIYTSVSILFLLNSSQPHDTYKQINRRGFSMYLKTLKSYQFNDG